MSSCGCKGMGGLGLDVPTPSGVLTANPCDPATDPRLSLPMLQQMLADLGFYKGAIGPAMTPADALQFSAATAGYAQKKGFDATTPQATACASLVADWQAKKAATRNLLIGGVAVLLIGGYLAYAWADIGGPKSTRRNR